MVVPCRRSVLLASGLLVACGSESDIDFDQGTSQATSGSDAPASSSGASGTGTATSTGTGTGTGTGNGTATGAGGAGGASASSSSTASGGTGGGSQVVRLIAVGDTGEGNEDQHLVADQMSAKCILVGGCDAVLMNGDNFYDHGVESIDDAQWEAKFELPYDRPGLNGLPFYSVLGNHDYGTTSSGEKQAQIDYTSLPVGNGPGQRSSDKWTMPSAYYDVQIGHVHLFALDTQDFGDEQMNDMSARVAASSATWKMPFGHHPRFTSGEHYFDNQALGFAGLYDLLESVYCGANIYMSGHDHDREFIDEGADSSCPEVSFIISGAGAKVRARSGFVPDHGDQLFYDEEVEGFSYLEFEGNTLKFEFIDKFGAVSFTKTLTVP